MNKQSLKAIIKFAQEQMTSILDSQHNYYHLQRVWKNSRQIIDILNIKNDIDMSLLQVCCFLHDIHYTCYKPSFSTYINERALLKEMLPNILNKFHISKEEQKTIKTAIYNHPFSFPFRKLNKNNDIYSQVLQDADTIDYFSEERFSSLQANNSKTLIYKFAKKFGRPFWKYGRKHLSLFLNFPELAERFYKKKT
ncbi:HD domain-containing protein [Candidatus Dojkabacteria bacterium]|nr:HD domain-containing protein [Candidatus Dojkabacteria bacterium]